MKKNPIFEFNMFMFIIVLMLVAIFEGAMRDTGRGGPLLNGVSAGSLYLWICFEFRRRGVSLRSFIGPLKFKGGRALCCLLADIACTTIFFAGGIYLLSFIFPQGVVNYLNEKSDPTLFRSVVKAPIVEEFFFRGILINIGGRELRRSLVISTVFFAIMHGRIGPVHLFGGYILGYLYIRSGSLMLSVLYHMAFNALVYVVSMNGTGAPVTLTEVREDGLTLMVLLFLGTAGALYIVKRTWREIRREKETPYERNYRELTMQEREGLSH